MSMRVLSSLQKKPQLGLYYELSSNDVFDYPVSVGVQDYSRFSRAQNDLADSNVFPKDYAYGISNHLKRWVWNKGWYHLPINVFCGQWAINLYLTEIAPVKFEETPAEEVDYGEMLYDELLVARFYIQGGMSLDEAVEKLKPMLKENWLELYANHKRAKLVVSALEMLSTEYGRPLKSYEDLID